MLTFVAGCAAGYYPSVNDLDAGPEQESVNDCGPGDGGDLPCATLDGVDPCAALVARSCEPSCHQAAACVAAELTRDYRPEECQVALDNQLTFPTCTASPCQTLVERTCGADEPTADCADNPGCQPSLVLRGRATDPAASSDEIADAVAACQQALEDAVVFAPCT
ncbi:MAG: hypothetical protein A2138_02670 [Deltaproteobacteria bacterium RBG_16_71_12]|nr:MAG: hypothetical protein A2138_02670 [Deltaproteobacteria bacterium RBG_16_71_12]